MNSEEITLCSGSVNQGGGLSAIGVHIFIYALVSICLWYLHVFSMHWYFLIFTYYLTVLNWLSLATWKRVEFTQHAGSFDWGGPSAFESQWHQWTVKRSLCALAVLTRGSICLWYPYLYICTGIHLPLVSTCFLYALVFPDIFLLFDCFELALIGDIEKHRVHSACWQFWVGGPSAFESQWHQWTVKRSLCALAVVRGGPSAFDVCIFIYALVFHIL